MADSVVAFQSMLKEAFLRCDLTSSSALRASHTFSPFSRALPPSAFLSFDLAIDMDSRTLPLLTPWQRIDFLVLTGFHYLFVLLVNTVRTHALAPKPRSSLVSPRASIRTLALLCSPNCPPPACVDS